MISLFSLLSIGSGDGGRWPGCAGNFSRRSDLADKIHPSLATIAVSSGQMEGDPVSFEMLVAGCGGGCGRRASETFGFLIVTRSDSLKQAMADRSGVGQTPGLFHQTNPHPPPWPYDYLNVVDRARFNVPPTIFTGHMTKPTVSKH